MTGIRVLVVDGFSNHDWRHTTSPIRQILGAPGLFAVDVSTAPPSKESPGWDAWWPELADYDVVIQNGNSLGGGSTWPAARSWSSARSRTECASI